MPIGVRALEAVSLLISSIPPRQPILLGIDGLGGAGKSTFAAALAEVYPELALIQGDDFYGPEERDWRSWTPEQGYERYFDHDRLENNVLIPLRAGERARFQRYDWARNRLHEWVRVEPQGIVVVEGVYLLRPRLRQYWDASIFVDTPRELRQRRMHARGENDAGWIRRWTLAEDYYERVCSPDQVADLVISGAGTNA